MEKVQVKFWDWLEAGFNLYKQHFSTLVLAAIIAFVLASITMGVLLGPLLAGLVLISLQLFDRADPVPTAGTVFRGFEFFLNSLLFVVFWGVAVIIGSAILSVLPIIGQLLSIFLIWAAQAYLMFGMFLIVDKKVGFMPASKESIRVISTNFWPFFGLAAVAGIIGSVGTLAFGIGIVLTMPIQICIVSVAYRDIFTSNENRSQDPTDPLF
jgi:uncharacterized membrane protein